MFLSVSVLVTLCCVPFGNPIDTGYRSYSMGPADDYTKSNLILPNTYQPKQQISSTPSFPSYGHAYQSMKENINGPTQPNPLEKRIESGIPNTYQRLESSSGQQYFAPINPQNNNNGNQLLLQAPHIKKLSSDPYFRAIHSSRPPKRYTIIHPNGSVEHTDEIHRVKAEYPNYILVKATDILGNVHQPIVSTNPESNWATKYPYQAAPNNQKINSNLQEAPLLSYSKSQHDTKTIKDPYYLPATTRTQNYQNQQWDSVNSNPSKKYNQYGNQQYDSAVNTAPTYKSTQVINSNLNLQQAIKSGGKQLPQIQLPANQDKYPDARNAIASNPATTENIVLTQNTQVVLNKPKDSISVTPPKAVPNAGQINAHHKNLYENVVAASPLPIYPDKLIPTNLVNSEKVFASSADNSQQEDQSLFENSIEVNPVASNSNSEAPTSNSGLQIYPSNPQASPAPVLSQKTPELHETLPMILPEVLPLNQTSKEIQTPTTIKESNEENISPDTTTIYENKSSDNVYDPNISESNNINSREPSVKPNEIIDLSSLLNQSKTNENKTNSTEVIQEIYIGPEIQSGDENNILRNPSSSPEALNEIKLPSGEPVTWFLLTNDWWESIRNSSNNIFIFIPPQPKVIKEIKTTIYPNGTSFEEITEKVMD